MDNQHRQIKGYRELSQKDIDLMNRIKEFGPQLKQLVDDVYEHVATQHKEASGESPHTANQGELFRLTEAKPFKWLEEGSKDLQKGLMFLTRAVAQPTFF